MILGLRTTVPPFPPQSWLLLFIFLNTIIHMYSTHDILYEVLIYIYGIMTLFDINNSL